MASEGVCKKMIDSGISYETLQENYQKEGQTNLRNYLSENIAKRKCRVTNNQKYVNNIIEHFNNKFK